ncbi:hypothetical protein KEU06_09180 [Pseudaminobacter sp. 19-2017]|uniref:Uncharacterized protein n=1 Tax=Pseudaminobacter soli (ex Zhang et al. 2022) TaxID=2831468 RepID=A0A942E0I7_9HYPH|nr:hypothetical protein [Pseudaminobacter soli]MBS3648776.1 hypothetical protein [Pseudaminobacter soli]
MPRHTYEQARTDHEYLWAYGPANDMTGGYVDQTDLAKLLKKPTKTTARNCYIDQIEYWFQVGPDRNFQGMSKELIIETDPAVREIGERYGCL